MDSSPFQKLKNQFFHSVFLSATDEKEIRNFFHRLHLHPMNLGSFSFLVSISCIIFFSFFFYFCYFPIAFFSICSVHFFQSHSMTVEMQSSERNHLCAVENSSRAIISLSHCVQSNFHTVACDCWDFMELLIWRKKSSWGRDLLCKIHTSSK